MEELVIEDGILVEVGNSGTRKRKKSCGKAALSKIKRYSAPKGSTVYHPCKHSTKTLSCSEVRPIDVKHIRNKLYKIPNKIRQDSIIASLIETRPVFRHKPNDPNKNKSQRAGSLHKLSVHYFITSSKGVRIPVCKNNFLSLTKVGRTRLSNIAKKMHANDPIEERRGGDRKSFLSEKKKDSVREFIRKLRGCESHYNRKKSKRIYLNCSLSIRKLHAVYNENCLEANKVHFAMFRRVFVNEFNIGFKSPASDVCSYCYFLDQKIKTSNSNEKLSFMIEKRIHKKRAGAFYSYLKEKTDDSVVNLCFDLQSIQALPKSNIQQAYYSRQINFYSLCITDIQTKSPTFYTWSQEQGGKGSVEVSSALHCHLMAMNFNGIKTLRLFCDGCISQNKNNINLHMLLHFLYTIDNSLQEIQLYFPVRGHSFLPADRVFGRVEKILKKKPVILSKEEYYKIYEKVGDIKILGKDWKLFATKSFGAYFKTLDLISEQKRIKLRKVKLKKGEVRVKVNAFTNYRFEDESEQKCQYLLKRGINPVYVRQAVMEALPLNKAVSAETKEDVAKLLSLMFGENWQELPDERFTWYKSIIFEQPGCQHVNDEEHGDNVACDCLENDIAVKI